MYIYIGSRLWLKTLAQGLAQVLPLKFFDIKEYAEKLRRSNPSQLLTNLLRETEQLFHKARC